MVEHCAIQGIVMDDGVRLLREERKCSVSLTHMT